MVLPVTGRPLTLRPASLAGRPVSPLAQVHQAADPRARDSSCLVQHPITGALFPAASRTA